MGFCLARTKPGPVFAASSRREPRSEQWPRFFFGGNLLAGLFWVLAGTLAATLGDLFASCLKRACQAADSSRFLGAHGGVYDRFDGQAAALPVLALGLVAV